MSNALISILAGLGGMIGWGTSDFFANQASDKVGHFKTFFWSQLVGIAFLLLLIPFVGLEVSLTALLFAYLVITSIFYSAGYLLFYKAFEIGNVSVVSAVINVNVVIGMLIAVVLRGQRLTPMQLFGVLLILIGVTFVAVNVKDLKNKKVELLSGVKETLMASLFFGVFWNLSEIISEKLGWLPTSLYVKVAAILVLVVFASLARKKIKLKGVTSKMKWIIILIGVLEAFAIASVNWGLEHGDLVLVSPISSALSVVTISLAVIFLKEKITRTQTFGIVLTITGILLTAF